jgi:L-rhamnose mutarotase
MIRKAFVMSVNVGTEEEYERRHRPIWPELEQVLKDHGVHNYSIFLHPETRDLFGYVEIEDNARWKCHREHRGVQKVVGLHEGRYAFKLGQQPDVAGDEGSLSPRLTHLMSMIESRSGLLRDRA